MIARDRLEYCVGNENNPGNPFGRQHLVIDVDGRARLDHFTLGPHFAWTGIVRPSVLDRLFEALNESDFPALPTRPSPGGGTSRSISIGNGLAASSTFQDYHHSASLPGYAVAFPLLDAIILQLSENTVKVVKPIAELLVDDVRATEEPEPRAVTAGMVYLLAYLPAHAVAHLSRKELVERFAVGVGPKLETPKIETSQRRIAYMAELAGIDLPAPSAEIPQWRAIADAVRPHLTTPLLQAAWSAGEAARLVAISVALLADAAYLRCSAPDHAELRGFAEERARALAENAEMLKTRLEATGLRLVISHANSVAKMVHITRSHHLGTTKGLYQQLFELERDLNSFMDGHAKRLDERE